MPQVNPFKELIRGFSHVINKAYCTNRLKPMVSSEFIEDVKDKFPEIIPHVDVITTKIETKSILNIIPFVRPKIEYECRLSPYDGRFLAFVTKNAAITSDDFNELVGLFSDITGRQSFTSPNKQKLGRIKDIIGQSLRDTIKEDGTQYDYDDYVLMLKSLRHELCDNIPYMYIDFGLPVTKQKLIITDLLNVKNLITDLAFGLFDGDEDYMNYVFQPDPPVCDNPEDDEVQETKDPNHLLELVTDFVSLSDQSKFMGSFSVSKEVGKDNADIELVVKTKDSTFEYSISLETNLPRCSEMRFGKKPKEASDKSDVIDFVKDCVGVITKITKEN